MRFKLTLNRSTKQRMVPMDYQYYISAWIYKVLFQADKKFAQFLHEHGYGKGETKLYKLFCFSRLSFGKPKLWKEKKLFEISTHEIDLQISFDVTEVASNFIKGLFMLQDCYLGDKFNGIDFKVTKVEVLPEPAFSGTMNYRLQTPWVVSYKSEMDKYPQYLTPNDDLFNQLAIKHLAEKFNNTRDSGSIIQDQIRLTISTPFRQAGFIMKPGTKEESRVVGNLFDFELTAPVEVHRMVWNTGVSEKSSSGFGWAEVVRRTSSEKKIDEGLRLKNIDKIE
jgi:CRISPR-associated endoribonuclease Cas6